MNKKTFLILLSAILLVNALGLFCDIFPQDSSLYATISKSFNTSCDFLNIYVDRKDWLDKPHFPFWVCGLFINLFGATTFTYKLPSFLFFCLGLFFTYRLSKRLYSQQVAYVSTLILGSSYHIILSNNDVRAEAILLGLVTGAVYYMHKLKSGFSIKALVLAALFSAAAIMTKGIFVLIIFYSAIFLEMLVKKELRANLKFHWLLLILLTFLFITPELYALYHQFDLHPEKTVFNEQNVSGIKFFLWDSQLGRFFNNSYITISSKRDLSFYIHTTLWSFAPWAFIGFYALIKRGRSLIKREAVEYTTFFAFLVMFVVFSLSQFQLPHYTNILFPFLSILAASAIVGNENKVMDKLMKLSITVYTVLFIAVVFLLEYFFRTDQWFVSIPILVIMMGAFLFIHFKKRKQRYAMFMLGVISSVMLFFYMNFLYYPKLQKYQLGSQVAYYINQHYPQESLFVHHDDWLIQYYIKSDLHRVFSLEAAEKLEKGKLVLFDEYYYTVLKDRLPNSTTLKVFEYYSITKVNKDFINHKTRHKELKKKYLIRI